MSSPELRRFVRRAVEGMQRPPIFEASDGHHYVLKLDTADPDFPAAELIAAHLAVAFGVPLPPFAVVHAPEVLVASLLETADPDLVEFGEAFARRGRTAFGSRYLGGATQRWAAALRHKVSGADEVLARLLVFDAWIENFDRSAATNPNLLVSNGRLYAIDHGQALPSVQGITGKRMPYAFDSHIAWDVVRERPHLLETPTEALRATSDAAIEAAVAAVPGEWWSDTHRPGLVVGDLRSRRSALPDTLNQLRKRLS